MILIKLVKNKNKTIKEAYGKYTSVRDNELYLKAL